MNVKLLIGVAAASATIAVGGTYAATSNVPQEQPEPVAVVQPTHDAYGWTDVQRSQYLYGVDDVYASDESKQAAGASMCARLNRGEMMPTYAPSFTAVGWKWEDVVVMSIVARKVICPL